MTKGTSLSTLCQIEKDGKYLMLHRTVKKDDVEVLKDGNIKIDKNELKALKGLEGK